MLFLNIKAECVLSCLTGQCTAVMREIFCCTLQCWLIILNT